MARPKSAAGADPGPAGRGRGGPDDPLGRGDYDAATGIWEWYEEAPEQGHAVTWEAILGHWPLLVADFAEHYGIRLRTRPAMGWAEFRDLTEGLLACDSRLYRATRPPEPEAEEPPPLFS